MRRRASVFISKPNVSLRIVAFPARVDSGKNKAPRNQGAEISMEFFKIKALGRLHLHAPPKVDRSLEPSCE